MNPLAYNTCCCESSFLALRLSLWHVSIYFLVVAFCPNNNEVHIYKFIRDKWERAHVLQKVHPYVYIVAFGYFYFTPPKWEWINVLFAHFKYLLMLTEIFGV